MEIKELLKKYIENMTFIEIAEARIAFWNKILLACQTDSEIYYYFENTQSDITGMPVGSGLKIDSEENKIINGVMTRKKVNKMIEKDESRIILIKHEINIINATLKILNDEEKLLIDIKFLDGRKWNWEQITNEFNRKFRNVNNEIDTPATMKIYRQTIEKMQQFIDNLCDF